MLRDYYKGVISTMKTKKVLPRKWHLGQYLKVRWDLLTRKDISHKRVSSNKDMCVRMPHGNIQEMKGLLFIPMLLFLKTFNFANQMALKIHRLSSTITWNLILSLISRFHTSSERFLKILARNLDVYQQIFQIIYMSKNKKASFFHWLIERTGKRKRLLNQRWFDGITKRHSWGCLQDNQAIIRSETNFQGK